jgi:hypothetical protein
VPPVDPVFAKRSVALSKFHSPTSVAALAELATKPEAAPNIAKSDREDNLFRFVFIVLIEGVSIG